METRLAGVINPRLWFEVSSSGRLLRAGASEQPKGGIDFPLDLEKAILFENQKISKQKLRDLIAECEEALQCVSIAHKMTGKLNDELNKAYASLDRAYAWASHFISH